MKNYLKIMEEAESHTRMVVNSFQKKKFANKFLLGLATLSLEKFMVAYLMAKDNLPAGHTLSFLVGEMGKYTTLPAEDIFLLESLDEKIQLCSLENIKPYIPTDEEMRALIVSLERIRDIVHEELVAEQS